MMRSAEQELKRVTQALIDEEPEAQSDARARGPKFSSWMVRAELVVQGLGGRGDVLARRLADVRDPATYEKDILLGGRSAMGLPDYSRMYPMMVDGVHGVLDALIKAIDDGLLTAIEDRVASDVYGDVLAEAKTLLDAGHTGCAAIFMRAGLENGLKRCARREGMQDVDKAKAAVVNDWLWKNSIYPKGTHDAVSGWLAPGNAFAHDLPEKEQYTSRDVAKALSDAQSFLGTLLV